MFNTSKSSKIRFNRIRQSKLDYIKHLIANKLGLVATASLTFLFGALFTLNISAIYAQPAVNPPDGNVNASFNSLDITGLNMTTFKALTTNGTVSFGNDLLVSGQIRNDNTNRSVVIADNLNLGGSLRNNFSSINAGAVLIDDPEGLDIRGPIQNNATLGRVLVNDSVTVVGDLLVYGTIGVSSPNSIGSFYTASRTATAPASNITITCPKGQIVSCTGRSPLPNTTTTQTSITRRSCTFNVTQPPVGGIPLIPSTTGFTGLARCFDPTAEQGDTPVTN